MIGDFFGKPALIFNAGAAAGGTDGKDWPVDPYISFKNNNPILGFVNPGDAYRSLLTKIVPSVRAVSAGASVGSLQSKVTTTATSDRSLLDGVLSDINRLKSKVSRQDQLKLDDYFEAIRSLENSIVLNPPTPEPVPQPPPMMQSCAQPVLNTQADTTNTSNGASYITRMKAFNDLIRVAFICDVARSASIALGWETDGRIFQVPPELLYQNAVMAGRDNHISISHASLGAINQAISRDRLYFSFTMDLVNKLKSATDASGSSILDNTIIHTAFGYADGNHGGFTDCVPVVVAGGRNFMSPGKSIELAANSSRDLLYTFSRHVGLNLTDIHGGNKIIGL
jgi:hypothetical protein